MKARYQMLWGVGKLTGKLMLIYMPKGSKTLQAVPVRFLQGEGSVARGKAPKKSLPT